MVVDPEPNIQSEARCHRLSDRASHDTIAQDVLDRYLRQLLPLFHQKQHLFGNTSILPDPICSFPKPGTALHHDGRIILKVSCVPLWPGPIKDSLGGVYVVEAVDAQRIAELPPSQIIISDFAFFE